MDSESPTVACSADEPSAAASGVRFLAVWRRFTPNGTLGSGLSAGRDIRDGVADCDAGVGSALRPTHRLAVGEAA